MPGVFLAAVAMGGGLVAVDGDRFELVPVAVD